MTLADVKNGCEVQVKQFLPIAHSGAADMLRLSDLGIVEGQRIQVIKRAPFGDPIQIELMGYQLCLRNEHARLIEVE